MFSVFRSVFLLLYLLLEMMLFTSAALPAEETQRDVANRVEVPPRILSADGVPDPPQDLIVDPQSAEDVVLIWTDPDDVTDLEHYLVYVEEKDMEYTTTGNYYRVQNLEACTDYTFGVQSVSAEGNMSDPVLGEGQTLVGAPPAPQNLQVDGYTSTTVTLSWDKPDTLCDIEEYKVRWTKDGLDTQSATTNETFFTVTELLRDTSYTFTVIGSTSYGDGPGATVQQTTDVLGGGAPENLVAVAVSSSAINVSWSPPSDEPKHYLVTAPPCWLLEEMVFGLSYLITGLNPCETCEIYVTSYYSETIKYTNNVRGTTDEGDPPPPESCSVQVEGDGLTVKWERPFSSCSLGPYSVQWTGTKLWGDEEQESGSGTASGTSYYVLGIVPYSLYTFEISTSIDGVFGSPASCNGTSPATQSSPPTALKQTANDNSSVTITWGLPQYIRGELQGWHLRWTTLDDEPIGEDTVNEVPRTYTISELSKSSTYVVYVSAVNGAGNGQEGKVNASTADISTENSFNLGVIIGLSAGGILLMILMVGGIIRFLRRRSSKPPGSPPHTPEIADADSDELHKTQHLSSADQGLYYKHGSVDNGKNTEIYIGPAPFFHIYETINEGEQMPDPPSGRRDSQQVSTSLPKAEGRCGCGGEGCKRTVAAEDTNWQRYLTEPHFRDISWLLL